MKPSLLIEAQELIAKLPKGGKKDLADRLGWYPAQEQMTQMAVMELRKMASNARDNPTAVRPVGLIE